MTRTASRTTPTVDAAAAERLAAALRCATISREDHTEIDPAEFDRLTTHLEHCFPLVHTHLECETFGHSRLYRWAGTSGDATTGRPATTSNSPATAADTGSAPSTFANGNAPAGSSAATPRTGPGDMATSAENPATAADTAAIGSGAGGIERVGAILLAHMDVVPVDDEAGWTHPPFAGVVDDEFIWGRGAIDDKSRVMAILEAVEAALGAGVQPRGTVYLAFGHDEEVFGEGGAGRMSARLRAAGVRADLLIDEGGVITTGVAAGVAQPVATIMVGEKGFATVRLSVTAVGGHSSMPGRQTAVGQLARAVARIQDHPFPLRLTPVTLDMLSRLRSVISEPRRTLLGLVGVAGPVVARVLAARPTTEALVRTTTAPTMISGGVKPNVLPQRAEAYVNFRILPGDSVADVLTHCRRVVRDKHVAIELSGTASEPSPDPAAGPAFELVADLAREVVPGVAVTVGIVPGATDARYYDDLAATRCNFAPIILTAEDLARIHGTDERISRANYARLITFNRRLIDRLAQP
ncbi:MAG: putative carboxypeptidase [Nocardia sp.]|uniref:M20/M25/M40 family metallo-hydrolase n=1 Tax=Nocardia sp. TaxID=1821 RepID=UPI002632AC02|nr:M20/M25/M40 family metallo-hydrolase [Nocardia sp.]MCU1644613.1 putative carboxypeptidase [Nocardia sp.]